MARKHLAVSAVRSAIAAQHAYAQTGAIPRGAFAVRAQADMGAIKSLIQGVNTSFNEFKASQEERLARIEADAKENQSYMDSLTVQIAGGLPQVGRIG